MIDLGIAFAMAGTAIAAIGGGYGSSKGVRAAGEAAAGVISEKPELFGKVLLLQAMPGSQGIYGFLAGLLVLVQSGILSGTTTLPTEIGLQFFAACLPVAVTCYISGASQGQVAAAGIQAIAKNPANAGNALILTAMVETFAILGLLVTILSLFSIKVS